MFQDTQPALLDANGGGDAWGEFRVQSPTEILALLRQLRDGTVPISLIGPSAFSLASSLWSIDDAQHRLNFSTDVAADRLDSMIEADELVAVAYIQSVKLQFELQDVVLVRGGNTVTLQTTFPVEMYRFQRREAYRVRPIDRNSPAARLRHPGMPDMLLELRVLDVSIGGCALFLPDDLPPLEAGTLLGTVRVQLDADTRFEVGLQLQHVTSIQPGQRGVRLGCEWRHLGGGAERTLQRYIDQTQKRRRLLSME